MIIHPLKFCVYTHRIADKIVYVGKGRGQRAFTSEFRNSKWRETVLPAGVFDVNIIDWFESSADAEDLEKQLIKEHKPICNSMHNGYSRRGVL